MTEPEITLEWPLFHISFDFGHLNEFPHSGISPQQNTLSIFNQKSSDIPPPSQCSKQQPIFV